MTAWHLGAHSTGRAVQQALHVPSVSEGLSALAVAQLVISDRVLWRVGSGFSMTSVSMACLSFPDAVRVF